MKTQLIMRVTQCGEDLGVLEVGDVVCDGKGGEEDPGIQDITMGRKGSP